MTGVARSPGISGGMAGPRAAALADASKALMPGTGKGVVRSRDLRFRGDGTVKEESPRARGTAAVEPRA